MDLINKSALRAAVLIHEQMAGCKRREAPLYLPDCSWNNIQHLRRQIDLARQHGWHRAATRLTEDLARTLDDCRRNLERAQRVLEQSSSMRKSVSAIEIYRDILALEREFDEVEIELQEHEVRVTTDRIVLEDIHFGRFEIRLDWERSERWPPYRVVALDPNPAAKSEDITHPHVQDEQLCEGEGHTAIRAAVDECRLYDLFMLVSQVLHTYGRGSAYVELDDWNGIPCEDCGDLVDADNRYYCDRCGSTLCGNCSISCQHCGNGFCSNCLSSCCRCGERFCASCLENCSVCRKRFCADCLEDGRCRSCHEKQHNEDYEHDPSQDARNEPVAVPV